MSVQACLMVQKSRPMIEPDSSAISNEAGGLDQAEARVPPAEQRLDLLDPAIGEPDNGLVEDLQLASGRRRAKIGLQLQALVEVVAHRFVEGGPAPASGLLGAVHGDVGMAEHLGGRHAAVRRQRDADAGVGVELAPGDVERARSATAESLLASVSTASRPSARSRSTVNSSPASRATTPRPANGGFVGASARALRRPIADLVAEAVVDEFEVVKIEKEHRRPASFLVAGFPERPIQLLPEVGAVGQARERVVEGLVAQRRPRTAGAR